MSKTSDGQNRLNRAKDRLDTSVAEIGQAEIDRENIEKENINENVIEGNNGPEGARGDEPKGLYTPALLETTRR